MVVRRGEVWWAELGAPRGSGPALRRPVMIVQADAFNRSAIRTVVVATLTANLGRADDPGNVLIPRGACGLPKESVVNVTQLATVDRAHLTSRVGRLPPRLLARAADGLRLVLAL